MYIIRISVLYDFCIISLLLFGAFYVTIIQCCEHFLIVVSIFWSCEHFLELWAFSDIASCEQYPVLWVLLGVMSNIQCCEQFLELWAFCGAVTIVVMGCRKISTLHPDLKVLQMCVYVYVGVHNCTRNTYINTSSFSCADTCYCAVVWTQTCGSRLSYQNPPNSIFGQLFCNNLLWGIPHNSPIEGWELF